MSYSTGLLKDRVTVLNKKNAARTGFGETTQYEAVATV